MNLTSQDSTILHGTINYMDIKNRSNLARIRKYKESRSKLWINPGITPVREPLFMVCPWAIPVY